MVRSLRIVSTPSPNAANRRSNNLAHAEGLIRVCSRFAPASNDVLASTFSFTSPGPVIVVVYINKPSPASLHRHHNQRRIVVEITPAEPRHIFQNPRPYALRAQTPRRCDHPLVAELI